MIRVKIFISLFAVATVIVGSLHMYDYQLVLWSFFCLCVGCALMALWKLKKVEP
ncbi:hypothetical protein [Flavobacterium sp.]|uniref:hypothetical protein n=1 Tax=Flavobacterium sp. TaxID=239 RepID=UPI004033FA9E